MIRFRSHRAVKVICMILVGAFLTLDIAWAHPPDYDAGSSTLAAPSLLQQNPLSEHAARLKEFVFSHGALLASVYDIGEYCFGRPEKGIEPLPPYYAKATVDRELGKILGDSGIEILNIVPVEYIKKNFPEALVSALNEIGFKGTLPNEGVVFVLYKKGDKKFLVQIAEKAKVSSQILPGYEWVVSDKYVVKYMPEDYTGEPSTAKSSLRGALRQARGDEAISF